MHSTPSLVRIPKPHRRDDDQFTTRNLRRATKRSLQEQRAAQRADKREGALA